MQGKGRTGAFVFSEEQPGPLRFRVSISGDLKLLLDECGENNIRGFFYEVLKGQMVCYF